MGPFGVPAFHKLDPGVFVRFGIGQPLFVPADIEGEARQAIQCKRDDVVVVYEDLAYCRLDCRFVCRRHTCAEDADRSNGQREILLRERCPPRAEHSATH